MTCKVLSKAEQALLAKIPVGKSVVANPADQPVIDRLCRKGILDQFAGKTALRNGRIVAINTKIRRVAT